MEREIEKGQCSVGHSGIRSVWQCGVEGQQSDKDRSNSIPKYFRQKKQWIICNNNSTRKLLKAYEKGFIRCSQNRILQANCKLNQLQIGWLL